MEEVQSGREGPSDSLATLEPNVLETKSTHLKFLHAAQPNRPVRVDSTYEPSDVGKREQAP